MKFIEKHIIQESVPVPKMLEAFNIYMVKKKKKQLFLLVTTIITLHQHSTHVPPWLQPI
jgi:hypothetical protein